MIDDQDLKKDSLFKEWEILWKKILFVDKQIDTIKNWCIITLVGFVSYCNVVTGVVIRPTLDGWIIKFQYKGQEYTLIIREGEEEGHRDWILIDPDGKRTDLVEDGKSVDSKGAGFVSGFSWWAAITKGAIGSTKTEMNERQAYDYARGLGFSEEEAHLWAAGYLMGLEAGRVATYDARYLHIVPSCLNDENWDKMCEKIYYALLWGYSFDLPFNLPWYLEAAKWIKKMWDYVKNIFD
jgi:hypothetical protein